MKMTDLAVLFVIISLPFVQVLRIQSDNLHHTAYKNLVLNRYLDTAVEDASEAMIIRGGNERPAISRDMALDAFYHTLLVNFHMLDMEGAREKLTAYIPVIILIDYDGYWVCSVEECTTSTGIAEQKMVWKPKKPYAFERENHIYLFTLDRQVKVMDMASNQFYEGNQQDLKAALSSDLIQQDQIFEDVRNRTIVEAIKKDVNDAINAHNAYAARFGITYRFSPPSISDADWHKNIEDVGFLAFLQGIPIGLGGERYNHFALGASRIVRKQVYYIEQDSNGLFYYHREQCSELHNKDACYDSREECANKGAFPCSHCNP